MTRIFLFHPGLTHRQSVPESTKKITFESNYSKYKVVFSTDIQRYRVLERLGDIVRGIEIER